VSAGETAVKAQKLELRAEIGDEIMKARGAANELKDWVIPWLEDKKHSISSKEEEPEMY